MPVISNTDTLLLRCMCHGHVLEISVDDWNDIPTDFAISVWNQCPIPITFWDRLIMIWTLVRGKNFDAGDVLVTLADAELIVEFLTRQLKTCRLKAIESQIKKHELFGDERILPTPSTLVLKFDPAKQQKL